MRMETYKPRPKKRPWVAIAIIMALVVAFGVWIGIQIVRDRTRQNSSTGDAPAADSSGAGISSPASEKESSTPSGPLTPEQAAQPAPGPKGMTQGLAEFIGPSPITIAPVSREQATSDLGEGLKLYAQNTDLLKARALLNRAYVSGLLAEPQAIQARTALEDLAERTVLRRDSNVNPQDPYMVSYTFRPGDLLQSRRKGGRVTQPGVIARNGLNVPEGVIVWVNGLRGSTEFRAGVSYKLLKGPFHIVVYKGKYVADIYLQDLFVRRIPVCIGAPETPTPEGYFRIVNGGKTLNSPYYPPAETGQANVAIYPGQRGYPLDSSGRNMKIEGITQLGTNVRASQSYAIHGTNDPSSVGKALSRGCLRLRDDDMRFVYEAFQDYAAPDDPRATWKRWSTVTILP